MDGVKRGGTRPIGTTQVLQLAFQIKAKAFGMQRRRGWSAHAFLRPEASGASLNPTCAPGSRQEVTCAVAEAFPVWLPRGTETSPDTSGFCSITLMLLWQICKRFRTNFFFCSFLIIKLTAVRIFLFPFFFFFSFPSYKILWGDAV